MIVGKLLCEMCGKDVTNGLWGFILGSRGTLNSKQMQQLEEFKNEFGKDRMVFCWNCIAKKLGAIPVPNAKVAPKSSAGEFTKGIEAEPIAEKTIKK